MTLEKIDDERAEDTQVISYFKTDLEEQKAILEKKLLEINEKLKVFD